MIEQTLLNNQLVNANAGGVFNGDFPPGTVAVKLETTAQYAGPAGGELDFNATMFDSDDGQTLREIGRSSGSGANSSDTFVKERVRAHWRVVFDNNSRMRMTVIATFFAAGDPIQ